MICPSIHLTFAAGPNDVARAILVVAEKRSVAMHPLFLIMLRRIERRIRVLRIVRDAPFIGQRLVVVMAIPIAALFPDVSRHVVKTETIWRKRFHRCDASVPVFACIFDRKFSLPCVRHPLSAKAKLIAPYINLS